MSMSNWHDPHDPFFDVRNIHSQVDSIFNGFLNDRRSSRGQRRENPNQWLPVVDVAENEKEIFIHVELPGIKKEDVHVDINSGVLTLSGEKKSKKIADDTQFHRVERSYGKFQRSFALPKGVDPSLITASFQDGVLELTVPKPEVKQSDKRRIEIK